MNIPGFTAELSLSATVRIYWREPNFSNYPGGRTIPQLRVQSGVDLGSYLRCLANGGDDLTCRFFGGLPPFTIGGLLF
jgi:hypothetical protein